MRRAVSLWNVGIAVVVALAFSAPALAGEAKGTIRIATRESAVRRSGGNWRRLKLGAQLAIEQLKGPVEKAGFKVELVPFDDQAKPDVGVTITKNMITDKDILAVVGHYNSGVAIPSSEIYKEAMLVEALPPTPTQPPRIGHFPNVNRVCGRDDVQGVVGRSSPRAWGPRPQHDRRQDHLRSRHRHSFRDHANKLGIQIGAPKATRRI